MYAWAGWLGVCWLGGGSSLLALMFWAVCSIADRKRTTAPGHGFPRI